MKEINKYYNFHFFAENDLDDEEGKTLNSKRSSSSRKSRLRICKIYDSPSLPETEATYCITSSGIDDPS